MNMERFNLIVLKTVFSPPTKTINSQQLGAQK
jgi:hypothetical protein